MPHQKAGASSDALSALPSELLTNIFTELPAGDICRARRFSKHIKNVIDANQRAILRPLMRAQRDRIKSDHKILHCKTKLSAQRAFQSFFNYYGLNKDIESLIDAIMRFTDRYLSEHYPNLPRYSRSEILIGFAALSHSFWSTTFFANFPGWFIVERLVYDAMLCGEHELAEQLEAIAHVFRPSVPRCPIEDGSPRFFLTTPAEGVALGSEKVHARCVAPCENTIKLLGLPSMRFSKKFAYCTKSHKVWALASKSWQNGGKKLTLFEKAALLEDIFIW